MATTLYLRQSNAADSTRWGGAFYVNLAGTTSTYTHMGLLPTRGSLASSVSQATVAGPTNGVEINSNMHISPPFAWDVRLSGAITFNIRASETAMNANVAINCRLFHINGVTGAHTEILKTTRTTEVGYSGEAANNWSEAPTSTQFRKGDRLGVVVFMDDAGTMGSGYYGSYYWDGPTASASGDTYITLPETIFLEPDPSGSIGTAPWDQNWRHQPQTVDVRDAHYANGYWVAVGTDGEIKWRNDPDPSGEWTDNSLAITGDFAGVTYGNGYWVAVGTDIIYYASDPTGTWTAASPGSAYFQTIAYGNGYWVVIGANGLLATSASTPPTAGSWVSNNQGTTQWEGIYYESGGGYWVLVGYYSNGGNLKYATNPSGTWTLNAQGTGNLHGVSYGNGYWVATGAAGALYYKSGTSPVGAWTSNPQGTAQRGLVIYANGYWVAGSGWIYKATNPTGTWSTGTALAEGSTLAYSDGWWVTTGTYQPLTFQSNDGETVTTIFPTAVSAGIDPGSATELEAWTSRGSGATNSVTATVNGPTSGVQLQATSGGTNVEWYTKSLNADVLTGAILVSVRSHGGGSTAPCSMSCEIAVCDGDGTNPVVFGRGWHNALVQGSETVQTFWVDGRDVAIPQGGRIRIRFLIDDMPGYGNMFSGRDITTIYGGAAGATGDTYLKIPVSLTEATGGSTTVESNFTANAVIKKTQTPTVTANAIVKKTLEFTPGAGGKTIDAQIARNIPGSLTANAVIFKTQTPTVTANAVLKKTITPTALTANAIARKERTGSLTADAVIKKTVAPTAPTANAVIKRGQSGSFSSAAVIKRPNQPGSATADAVLRKERTGSLTADAVVKKTQSGSVSANAVVKKTQSGSFTSNAVVLRSQSGTLTANAVIRKTASGSTTANAVVRRGQSGSFSADAVIRRLGQTGTATANAVLRKERAGSLTADSVIRRAQTGSIAADAIVKKTITVIGVPGADEEPTRYGTLDAWFSAGMQVIEGSKTADAIIRRGQAGSLAADAVLRRERTGSLTANAVVKRTQSGSVTANAVIKRTQSGTLSASAVIKRLDQPGSFAANAIIKRERTGSGTADAVLRRERTGSLTADAVLRKSRSQGVSLDAIVLRTVHGLREHHYTHNDAHFEIYGTRQAAQTFLSGTPDGITHVDLGVHVEGTPPNALTVGIYATSGGEPTGAALVTGTLPVAGVGTDEGLIYRVALSSEIRLAANTLYAIVVFTTGGDANNDWHWNFDSTSADYANGEKLTYLAAVWTAYPTQDFLFGLLGPGWFSADAVLVSTTSASASADAVIRRLGQPGSGTADAIIRKPDRPGSGTADAVIRRERTGSLTANAIVLRAIAGTATANAVVKRGQAGSVSGDAVVRRTALGVSPLDAVLRRGSTASLTTDAIVRRERASAISADAVLLRSRTGSLTADAVIRRGRASSLSGDAVIRRTQSGSFSAAAVIKRADQIGTATANAVIKREQSSSLTAAAVLARSGSGSASADAVLLRSWSATFAGDAVVRRTTSGPLSSDAVIRGVILASLTTDAILLRGQSGSFSIDAVINSVSKCIWTTPGDTIQISPSAVLHFLMPLAAAGNMHFEIQIDTVNTFDSVDLQIIKSHSDLTGWEFWDGGAWLPIDQAGVPNTYCGNEARYAIQTPLTNGTWYRRVRAGVI